MPKQADKKKRPEGESNKRKANHGSHVRTLCGWCDKQIARGMSYCNRDHRRSAMEFRRAGSSTEKKEEVMD